MNCYSALVIRVVWLCSLQVAVTVLWLFLLFGCAACRWLLQCFGYSCCLAVQPAGGCYSALVKTDKVVMRLYSAHLHTSPHLGSLDLAV